MAFVLFGSALLSLVLTVLVLRRYPLPGAVPFAGLQAGIAFYCAGYAAELVTAPGAWSPVWNHVQYLGAAFLPGFWLWLSVETPRGARPVWVPMATLLIPVVTLVLNLTNEAHHLYYQSIQYYQEEGLTLAALVPGPWYAVHALYTLVSFPLGVVLFLVGSHRLPRSGSPSLGIIAATLPTLVAFLLYQTKAVGGGVDVIPLGLTATGLLYFWMVWPLKLFDLGPVTREAVFRLVPDPVFVVDSQRRVVDWNPAAGALIPALTPGTHPPVSSAFAGRTPWLNALMADAPTARVLPWEPTGRWWSVTPTRVADGRNRTAGWVYLLHEETDLVRRAEVYQELAMVDELTGCLNRRAFTERARALLASRAPRQEPTSLIAIDLDHFKEVNDSWGHAAGDVALKHAVHVWEAQLRSGDLLGRLGGEEFAVLLPGTPVEVALAVAGRLCSTLRELPAPWEGSEMKLTASFGVAGTRDSSVADFDALMAIGDRALYEAKELGRDRVVQAGESTLSSSGDSAAKTASGS